MKMLADDDLEADSDESGVAAPPKGSRALAALGLCALVSACFDPSVEVGDDASSGTRGSSDGGELGPFASGTETGAAEPGAMCGNGIVEPGESCDHEGASPTCDPDCTPVDCGDGLVNEQAGEQCDDQGPSGSCSGDCMLIVCGDGVVDTAAGEDCDGLELAGQTCQGLGFEGGELSCGASCTYDTSTCDMLPQAPVLELSLSQVKRFDFAWGAVANAEYYQLLGSPAPGEPFVQIGGDIIGESVSVDVPLHLRTEASHVLRACNGGGCTDSSPMDVVGSLAEAVGYFKASNPGVGDSFGHSVALSDDGNTLAIGARYEDSGATMVGGNQVDDSAPNAGAVFVFVRDAIGSWSQQAYVKASNAAAGDQFGASVKLSVDGNTLAIGASDEDSGAQGIGGDQSDDSAPGAGASYVFVRDGMGQWSQQAYIKASNPGPGDYFGLEVALSGDGDTLAVGAHGEDSNETGIDGNQADESAANAGAVYVFSRDGLGGWSQQAYVKASNTDAGDQFGLSVALSGDGDTLVVGAHFEDSNALGIGGNQTNDSASAAGAAYVFVRSGMGSWSQQAYVKASNTDANDRFGRSVALNADGNTLTVGAHQEDSSVPGVGGNQNDNAMVDSGAVYVFARSGIGAWSQQSYVKASNPGAGDWFGRSLVLSADGNMLVSGGLWEDGIVTGLASDQGDDTAQDAGAAYVFLRDGGGDWSQQVYVKASNTDANDRFGLALALSGDGNVLAIGADWEDGGATGIGGDQADDGIAEAGAVYLY